MKQLICHGVNHGQLFGNWQLTPELWCRGTSMESLLSKLEWMSWYNATISSLSIHLKFNIQLSGSVRMNFSPLSKSAEFLMTSYCASLEINRCYNRWLQTPTFSTEDEFLLCKFSFLEVQKQRHLTTQLLWVWLCSGPWEQTHCCIRTWYGGNFPTCTPDSGFLPPWGIHAVRDPIPAESMRSRMSWRPQQLLQLWCSSKTDTLRCPGCRLGPV